MVGFWSGGRESSHPRFLTLLRSTPSQAPRLFGQAFWTAHGETLYRFIASRFTVGYSGDFGEAIWGSVVLLVKFNQPMSR